MSLDDCTHSRRRISGNGLFLVCQLCWRFAFVFGGDWRYPCAPPAGARVARPASSRAVRLRRWPLIAERIAARRAGAL